MGKIIDKLVSASKCEREIIVYGVKVIFFNAFSVSLILLVSYMLHCFLFGVVFICSFGFVRLKIGGFHCKSLQSCIALFMLLFMTIYFFSVYLFYYIGILFLSIPSIICFHYLLKRENKKMFYGYYIFIVLMLLTSKNIIIPFYSGVILGEILYFINMQLIIVESDLN
ncbi:accessory gene regulator B family protein [Thomasclavelia sp.]|uniref:accessory gene regulator B family protein n=1 Tax=Thomasclavelia sp. TaxID=3025757 RepID=UPI00345D4ED6